MISQQQIESTALAATQSLEGGGINVPIVQVSFPFPDVFGLARFILNEHISKRQEKC